MALIRTVCSRQFCKHFQRSYLYTETCGHALRLICFTVPVPASTTLQKPLSTDSRWRPLPHFHVQTKCEAYSFKWTLGHGVYYSPFLGLMENAGLHTWSGLLAADKKQKGQDVSEKSDTHEHGSVLMQFVQKKEEPKQLTVGAKVVQAGKDVSYLAVIVFGFAVAGFLLWSVSSEYFSSNTPSSVFTKALKRVKADPRVVEALGEPIAGHGEHSGRGRRRHIVHQEYIVDGMNYMRVKFFVDGSKRKGTVLMDLKKNDRGKYECRFLLVELQGYPPSTIVIEDNR